MLMILIQWCYFAAVSFLTGIAVITPFEKRKNWHPRYISSYMMAGLLVLNVYAQFFSLFAGVDLAANVIMVCFAAAAGWICRGQIGNIIHKIRKETGWKQVLLYGFLVLLFSYGSSRGYMHFDTGLYHAQSIRWIQEYGVVPGLANLHNRFGYNSAAFALCALFGGAGLTAEPMHCVPGFFALLCAIRCTRLGEVFGKKRTVQLADFLYMGCIFYLVAVFRELVSPASDYFAMLILFYVAMCWVEELENKQEELTPFCLLSLCLVWALSVKLSAAVMLLLVVHPAILLLRQKKWKEIGVYLGLGILIVLPWLARNVLISGWLLYPFTLLDFFAVDWKIPRGYADYDRLEIQVYGKELFDVNLKDTPFLQWFPNWFAAQGVLDKALVLAGWLAVPLGAALLFLSLMFRLWKKERDSGMAPGIAWMPFLILQFTSLVGFLVWQFGAPLVRYGCFFVLFLPLVMFGTLFLWAFDAKMGKRIFQVLLVAFLLYRGYNLTNMVVEMAEEPYYIQQQEYGTFDATTYEVDGITIYVPSVQGQIGYDKFPSSPVVQDIRLRGESLKSGFRANSN